jgi:hypothetical protein
LTIDPFEASAMRQPRVRFTVRRMVIAAVAVIAAVTFVGVTAEVVPSVVEM